jgi:heptaprenyl diphosphate synthase
MNVAEPIERGRSDPPAAVVRAGLAEVEASTRAGLVRVEHALNAAVQSSDEFIRGAATTLIDAGGKRFRPTCVLLAGHFGDPEEPALIPAAVAVELTHLSSLYHDDVIDEAELRRGVPSVNTRHGNHVAILTGDYLFARASEITADLGQESSRILARTIARLTQGQIGDVRGPSDGKDPVEHYMWVLSEKTGALIGTACRLGGLLSGAKPDEVEALTEFGERLGVAFQLADDLLDIAQDESSSGKLPGTDLREGVRTLPVLYLLRARGRGSDVVERVLDADEPDEGAVGEALDVLRGSQAFEDARGAAAAQVELARESLDRLPDIPARAALEEVARRVLDRDR